MLTVYCQAQDALWEMIESGAVQILPLGTDDIPRTRELMRKYRDLPMDLADAGLVCVAERERLRRISRGTDATFKFIAHPESAASPSFPSVITCSVISTFREFSKHGSSRLPLNV